MKSIFLRAFAFSLLPMVLIARYGQSHWGFDNIGWWYAAYCGVAFAAVFSVMAVAIAASRHFAQRGVPPMNPDDLPFVVGDRVRSIVGPWCGTVIAIDVKAEQGLGKVTVRRDGDGAILYQAAIAHGLVRESRNGVRFTSTASTNHIHLQQRRACSSDDFRAMVEAKTRRFAGTHPAHRPRRDNGSNDCM